MESKGGAQCSAFFVCVFRREREININTPYTLFK